MIAIKEAISRVNGKGDFIEAKMRIFLSVYKPQGLVTALLDLDSVHPIISPNLIHQTSVSLPAN